jgi:hypothetical protein
LNTGSANRSADLAERATRRGQDRMTLGHREEAALAERQERQGRKRHDGDRRAQLVEQGVLGPRVATTEQADWGAVALDHRVAAGDDVPVTNGHFLGLHDLAGMGGADLAVGRELLELIVGEAGEERHGAQGFGEVLVHGRVVRGALRVGDVGAHRVLSLCLQLCVTELGGLPAP